MLLFQIYSLKDFAVVVFVDFLNATFSHANFVDQTRKSQNT